MRVYAFVGPSGTGKSYRAQLVAGENNIKYIIDDGLLIDDNEVVAGTSAKKAPTKIETIKHALFNNEEEKRVIIEAFERLNPEGVLILGTSDGMVKKIAANLGLPKISKTIYINEVATEEEMQKARRMRVTEGKHVIPVPTFEIKKDFSGFLLDPLQIFKSKGSGNDPYIAEKSIIRPTFSYIGNFTISDTVFRQIIKLLLKKDKDKNILKLSRIRIDKYGEGMYIYMEAVVLYGCTIPETVRKFQVKVKKEIERLTSMNVQKIEIYVKSLKFDDDIIVIN
ncbi:MAG: Asp23/Gls24 family envelope stress response protein [Clostridia bacterium]|nr:Asp23/Gls24 family envelope stress response protein [Clostridia bacterium]